MSQKLFYNFGNKLKYLLVIQLQDKCLRGNRISTINYIVLLFFNCFTFIIPYYCSILSLLFVESTKEGNAVAVDDFSQSPHHIHIAACTLIHPLEEKKRKSLINDFYPTISSGHMNHHGASTQKIPSKSKQKIPNCIFCYTRI